MNKDTEYLTQLKEIECPDATFFEQESPLVMERAQGSTIYGLDGKSHIDLCAGFGALPIGHNHPKIVDAIRDHLSRQQLVHGLGDVFPSRFKIDFLHKLSLLFKDDMRHGAFAVTGGQAVEYAMKTALLATGRDHFIAFDEAYHGVDFGSLTVTERPFFRRSFSNWLLNEKVTFQPFGCPIDLLEKQIESKKTAGVLIEPIQGRAGVRAPPEGWLHQLYEVCQKNGTLVIFDEVFTGFGRTGQLFLCDTFPCDIVCLGKAIGGGMPLSAFFAKKQVMDAWQESQGEAVHTGTYFGHPLSCLVGLKTLEVIIDEDLVARSKNLGSSLVEKLSGWAPKSPIPFQVRGSGLMVALDFQKEFAGAKIMGEARRKGVVCLASGLNSSCVTITPALNIPEEMLWQSMDIIEEILYQVRL